MPIEKIGDCVYIVYKNLYDPRVHNDYYAINNNDKELLEYRFEEFHYTHLDLQLLIQHCIARNNIEMLKLIVEYFKNNFDEDRVYHTLVSVINKTSSEKFITYLSDNL